MGSGGRGCGIPPASLKGYHTSGPGAELDNARTGIVEGCPGLPRGSGYARPTGYHTTRRPRSPVIY